MARFNDSIFRLFARANRLLFPGLLSLLAIPETSAGQNLHIESGGITITSGSTLHIPSGSLTLGNTAAVNNNGDILLSGNWTNNGGSYSGGNISFTGNAPQQINGTIPSHILNNVTINQAVASTVTLNANTSVASLGFTSGKMVIGGNTLTIGGAVTNTVSGGLRGSASGSIIISAGNNAGSLSFDLGQPGTTNVLRNLSLGSNATATLASSLNIDGGTTTLPGTLTLNNGSVLNTGDSLTLKSTAAGTARLAEIPVNGAGSALATLNGKVTTERWISARRAWRLVSVPLQHTLASETSIWNAWQEGVNNTVDLTTGGNYATDNRNPNPGFGTHITCDRGLYNPLASGFDAASLFSASLLSYNGSGWGGKPANTKSTFVTSQPGWMLFVRGSRAVNLSQGAQSLSDATILRPKGLLRTGRQTQTTVANTSGYNVIGNPFASSINLSLCRLNGTAITDIGYYAWDPYLLNGVTNVGAYSFYDPVLGFVSTPVSPIAPGRIESGSAFLIAATGGQTIEIPESAKLASNSLVMRPLNNPERFMRMKTSLYIESGAVIAEADGCGIVADDIFSNDFFPEEDKLKLNNFSENLGIAAGGKILVVDYRKPFTSGDTVWYRINRMSNRNYRLRFEPSNLGNTALDAQLEDKFTGLRTPVSLFQTTEVPFTVSSDSLSRAADRFRLVFKQAQPVPLKFISVDATAQNNPERNGQRILIAWKVANEEGIRTYQIEKSANGDRFAPLDSPLARTRNNPNGTYQVFDSCPAFGKNQYRIAARNFSGEIFYSPVVSIHVKNPVHRFYVYPNPAKNNSIQLQLAGMTPGKYSLEMTNTLGQLVLKREIILNTPQSVQTIVPASPLAEGVYHLSLIGPGRTKLATGIQVKH